MADTIFNSSTSTTDTGTKFNLSGLNGPTDMVVDPAKQTVAGQLSSVMSADSPLIQQARSRAMEQMNARGLANSSMALSAADSAAYEAAVPIAKADAATYFDAAKTNTDAQNQFKRDNNTLAYDLQKAAVNQEYNQKNLGTQFNYDVAKMNLDTANTLSKMSVEQQNSLAKMAAQQGYNMETLTAEQLNKLQLMQVEQNNNLQTLSTQFGFDVTKMDKQAASTLAQMSVQQQNDIAKMASAHGYDMQTLSAQQANELQKMQVQQQNNMQTLSTQYGFDVAKMDKQTASALQTMGVDQQNKMAQLAAQNGYDLGKMNLQQTLDLAKLDKQTAAALNVADIEANYKNLTQGSAAATSILGKMQDSLNALAANKDVTDPAVRTSMAADIKTNAMDSLNLIGAMAGDVDLSSYIQKVGI